ncbi:ScbR family autoregulator-binding transcription factor [Kitasatospora sp. GAS204B]|uniref:ScbR family autoregulator-binding transcription factor n=1 Tax=unclassified Kitasatospora TaxID=2633591 RepID=UPI00247668CB|nr:ScbR family autoregulator-binding transcription factor [Kitasatospora sp. GAS204B]MDH6118104.1 AcrR family transcriptional regulator [Kitasatospora sp. GAS204B]
MSPEPKQERAVRTRDEILQAAAQVFDEHGYHGASMREIIKRAGVTLGAVYFHFPNKEALARAVMTAQTPTIMPRLASQGLQRLVDLTLVWSRQLQIDPVLRAGVRLTGEQTGFGLSEVEPYRVWVEIMQDCLRTAERDGELLAGIDVHETAEFVVSACTGMQMYAQIATGRADLSERTVSMWRLLLPALATEAAAKAMKVGVKRAYTLVP